MLRLVLRCHGINVLARLQFIQQPQRKMGALQSELPQRESLPLLGCLRASRHSTALTTFAASATIVMNRALTEIECYPAVDVSDTS